MQWQQHELCSHPQEFTYCFIYPLWKVRKPQGSAVQVCLSFTSASIAMYIVSASVSVHKKLIQLTVLWFKWYWYKELVYVVCVLT